MPFRSAENPVPRWCREIERQLRAGEPCRAEEYLRRAPGLDPEDAVEVVYAEFVGRGEIGDTPDPAEYLARFPELDGQLREQFLVHEALHAAADGPPQAGQSVGPYRLGGEIGRGSRGAVFVAHDSRDGRRVALKLLLSGEYATPDDLALFRQEAGVIARLDHAHLIRIYDAGVADGRPYLALEYADGPTLARRLADYRDPRRAAELVETLARAVHHAHLQGVVHRDLKPGNVLLAAPPEGEPDAPAPVVPKVTDFGLARILDAGSGRTRTGDIVGTLGYMAPEQAAGTAHRAGPPADVYALGAILYELLTGRVPFGPGPSVLTLYQVLHEPPPPLRRLARGVPRDLETVCLRCLEKHPDRRYPSALELADDLRRFLDGRPVAARPVGTAAQLGRWAARRPAVAALGVVTLVAAVGLTAGSLYYSTRLSAALGEADRLQRETARSNDDLHAALATAEDLRAETRRQKDVVERQLDDTRRVLYALQLAQLPALWLREPIRAKRFLDDTEVCRPEYRDFTWGYFHRLCRLDERSLSGHRADVRAVAFLPDRRLVSGAADGQLRYWSPFATKGRRAGRVVAGHTAAVTGVVVLAGGRRVATAGLDRAVRVWDVGAARPAFTIAVPAPVNGLAVSPDGRRLAGPCEDGVVRVWDAATGREEAALTGHAGPVAAAAFAPDGRTLATGGDDRLVRLWSLADFRGRAAWAGQAGPVLALAFSPDGRSLVSTGEAGDVRLWDTAAGSSRPLRGHLRPVRAAAFTPGGDRLATGGNDSYLKLWDAATGQDLTNVMQEDVACLAVSADGQWVAGGGRMKRVTVYRLPTYPPPARYPDPANVATLAARPGGGAVTADVTGEVRVWDAGGGKPVARLTLPPVAGPDRPLAVLANDATVLAVSPDGATLALAAADGGVMLWDFATRSERGRLAGLPGRVTALAFHPDGRRLLAGRDDGTVRVWDLATRQPLLVLRGHTHPVLAVAASADGKWLAAGGEEKTVRLWDARTGEPGPPLGGDGQWVLALAFHPSGRALAAGDRNRTVRLWDLDAAGPPVVIGGFTNWVYSVAFSPDGRTLAAAAGHYSIATAGEIKLCDPNLGCVRAILPDFKAPAAFTADGKALLVGARDGVVELTRD